MNDHEITIILFNINRNRKVEISTAPTETKSREPAYSQALNQNKIKVQRARQTHGQGLRVFRVELARKVKRNQDGIGEKAILFNLSEGRVLCKAYKLSQNCLAH